MRHVRGKDRDLSEASALASVNAQCGSPNPVIRGQIWLAFDEGWPLVILSQTESAEYRAIRVVTPATIDRGIDEDAGSSPGDSSGRLRRLTEAAWPSSTAPMQRR
jgi:hypothetical protein